MKSHTIGKWVLWALVVAGALAMLSVAAFGVLRHG